ncbi:LysR substrate-binding domain-containing protein [Streptomyces sp. TRM76323]|uniref:LysR substrate-binding domain-containing protein n=1 Tax=Streptomyces tamarix TaxID=3078565 RepID=A0ABU3QRE4_9ACTN|nr:LysR substrate-binding domain-containing protein [Streptomyces tamarix]MDT9685329.1 LysR substrate-binding domain-containing protein [Streptomyces tamarix]
MELRQLEYFVAVAEEGSFTRAAARLYVAQPGVSAQIRRLEQELGEQLLDRSGRTVRLTEVGAEVLAHARRALAGVTGMRLAVDEFTGLLRGRVSVGMVRSCSSVDLPELLASFHEDHPAVEITLAEDNTDRLLEDLHRGVLDAAVVALTTVTPPGVGLHVITDESLVVVVRPGDPLAGRPAVPVEALRERPLVSLPRGTGMRACLDQACADAGFAPRVAFEASDPHVLARLAARGLGPAVVPASLAAALAGELHAVTVTSPRFRGRMALAWRSDGPAGPAARAFVAHARTVLPAAGTTAGTGDG